MRKMMNRACLALLLVVLAAPVQALTLKVATLAPAGTTWLKEMQAGAQRVEDQTEGRLSIKFYPGGVMGNDATVLRKIRIGQLHGGAFTAGGLVSIYPDAQIYGLPFLLRTYAEVDHLRKKFDAELKAGFAERGWLAVGLSEGGFSYLMSQQPVKAVDDLSGQKVWVPEGDQIAITAFQKAGVSPVTLPIPDVYTGLQTRLINTVTNSPSGAIALQWHTGVKYLTDVPLSYILGTMIFADKALRGVSAADRAVLTAEMSTAFTRLDEINRRDNREARAALEKLGIQPVEPGAAELARWQQVADAAIEALRDDGLYTPALYDRIRRELDRIRSEQALARP